MQPNSSEHSAVQQQICNVIQAILDAHRALQTSTRQVAAVDLQAFGELVVIGQLILFTVERLEQIPATMLIRSDEQ
jgi:hypothetical protein